jgi:hypothetical protein
MKKSPKTKLVNFFSIRRDLVLFSGNNYFIYDYNSKNIKKIQRVKDN